MEPKISPCKIVVLWQGWVGFLFCACRDGWLKLVLLRSSLVGRFERYYANLVLEGNLATVVLI